MVSESSSVPSCHLYTLEPGQRIRNELDELGIDPDGLQDTNVLLLNKIDGMRYEDEKGTLVFIDYINQQFGSESQVNVLDVGSGFAGPARLLAFKRPTTNVTALEFVPEISTMAQSLTQRCPEVKDKIQHKIGNVEKLSEILPDRKFHAAQGVLTFCHVPDLEVALIQVHSRLEEDGMLYIEDFWASQELSQNQEQCLSTVVGCVRMPPSNVAWCGLLSKAGFATVEFEDVTKSWQAWVQKRSQFYTDTMERHVRVHGEQGARHMLDFYSSVDKLFASGNLKGCRILAKKVVGDVNLSNAS